MDKRIRSPNYPAISLPQALERVAVLYKNQHTHAAPREVVAKSLGYTSLSGPAASLISALHKYGLLERDGDGIKISERALKILHPHSDTEKQQALRDAANEPPLFVELNERFPGPIPNEELLRNYLVRKGFSPNAVTGVIRAYRETSEFVGRELGAYDSPETTTEGPTVMRTYAPIVSMSQAKTPTQKQGIERSVARYDLEGGKFIRISVGGDMDTEEVLEWAEELIRFKRKELERQARRPVSVKPFAENEGEKDDTENNA